MKSTPQSLWLASFDIGKKNFSFYIEELEPAKLDHCNNIPKFQRYESDGTPTAEFKLALGHMYSIGTKILLENVDLTDGCDKNQYLDPKTMYNMIEILDKYSEYWKQCDVFVIEKQMSFGRKYNTMALKLGQHCWSYFAIKHGNVPIVEFPAYHKTQILGAGKTRKVTKTGKVSYKSLDKRARKKWCIEQALAILDIRADIDTAVYIQATRKKDDLCDVICQLQAFKYLNYIDKSNQSIIQAN